MAVLHDNTSHIRGLIADISTLPADRYETGIEEGYAKGYSDGRSSLDVLTTLGFETFGTYYGKILNSFGDQKLILLITLKKGKTVPKGHYFGYIMNSSTGSTTAAWAVNNGTYNHNYSYYIITPSKLNLSMIGCYPPQQEVWDAFMDAFDVRVELIDTEI